MNTIIRAAIVAAKNQIPAECIQLAERHNIVLAPFTSIDELKNSEYFDVVLLQEVFLPDLRRMPKVTSSLIFLANQTTSITDLLPRIADISYYTVLQLPCSAEDIVEQIRKGFEEAREQKISVVNNLKQGKTIAVTSFANGVGKTMVAYNLAHKLALFLPDDAVCLTDMNVPLSAAKAMINIEETYSWNTIRPILKEGVVSASKIQNIVYPTSYRFQLLGGPTTYTENAPLSDREYQNLTESLANVYTASLIDMPTISQSTALKRLESVDTILIVLDATGNGILQTKRGLAMMQESAPELLEKTRFVMNRVDGAQGKTAELIASRFGIEVFAAFDNDPEAVSTVIDVGKLFQDKTLLLDAQFYQAAEKLIRSIL